LSKRRAIAGTRPGIETAQAIAWAAFMLFAPALLLLAGLRLIGP